MIGQTEEHRLLIVLANICRHTTEEALTCSILWHTTNVATHQLHSITPITTKETVAILRLRGRAIDDSYEIICDDDAILAFLRGILWDECLLYYFHG